MVTANLLVELFVEELPPKALKKLGEAFAKRLFDELVSTRFVEPEQEPNVQGFASPRRLAVLIPQVRGSTPATNEMRKLMPKKVAYDAAGQPTKALLKKLEGLGYPPGTVPTDDLVVQGDDVMLHHAVPGRQLPPALQTALEAAIKALPIPKVMTYQLADGWSDVKFVRPAHSLVALHGREVVAVEVLGLKAGNTTRGHRFEASIDSVRLNDADSYAATLEKEGAVIASFEARRAEIVRQLAAAASKVGGGARAIEDPALLDEVTGLVERPNVLTCRFETEFLEVPQECLILTMKANQKYFPLLDGKGKLTHRFLVVSNIRPDDASAVILGNERVVRPRLADAKFFFDQDRKKTLASRVSQLGKVVYHNKLGTQGERTDRVRAIARAIAQELGGTTLAAQADEAAMLAKADLVTDMVGEFPELQGTMGRYYALNDKLPAEVADAIEDHDKPRFAGDTLPRGQVGMVVALADKIETIMGLFAIGQLPTGEKDPFALRRHALGICRLLIEGKLDLELGRLIRMAMAEFEQFAKTLPPQGASEMMNVNLGLQGFEVNGNLDVFNFLFERLSGYFRDLGYSSQEIGAVTAFSPQMLSTIPMRLAAVRAFSALPEAPALAAANKRISNILKKAGEADAHVSEALLQEPAEQDLYAAMKDIAPRAAAQFESGDYTASLQTLAALRGPVDAFFDGVMVNAEQSDLRLNRLGLLATLHRAMNRVADLSRLAA